jgi:hypothetical protein
MKYCSSCGTPNDNDAECCKKCGAKIGLGANSGLGGGYSRQSYTGGSGGGGGCDTPCGRMPCLLAVILSPFLLVYYVFRAVLCVVTFGACGCAAADASDGRCDGNCDVSDSGAGDICGGSDGSDISDSDISGS